MKTSELYKATEELLKKYESAYEEAEKKINELMTKAEEAEALSKKYRDEAIQVESDNKTIKNNVMNLREIMTKFEQCDFAPSEEELKKEKEETVKKETLSQVKVKPAKVWVKRKGEIGQFKPDGTIFNSFTSQRSAANSLRWDVSSVSRFMKLERDNQIRKKGFYLEYMG